MDLLLPLILPTIVLQTLSGRQPLLLLTPAAGLFIGLGGVAQLLASRTQGYDSVLVRAAFIFGTIALGLMFRSSGSRPAFCAAVGGAVMNLVPILAYGAMPVSADQLEKFDLGAVSEAALTAPKHSIIDITEHPIALLADTIPIEPLHALISAGDIVLFVGFVLLALGARSRHLANTTSTGHLRITGIGAPR